MSTPLHIDAIAVAPDPAPARLNLDADIDKVNEILGKPWSRHDLTIPEDDRFDRGSPGRSYEVTHMKEPARLALKAAFEAAGWVVGRYVPRLNQSYVTPDDGRRWLVFFPSPARVAAMLQELR